MGLSLTPALEYMRKNDWSGYTYIIMCRAWGVLRHLTDGSVLTNKIQQSCCIYLDLKCGRLASHAIYSW